MSSIARIAALMSRVKMEAERPYRLSLSTVTADSNASVSMISVTGPKISSWAIRIRGPTLSKIVGV